MVIPFDPECPVQVYADKGKAFSFPHLDRCKNQKCRNPRVHRHGFYWRYVIDGHAIYWIPIRRYYCPQCRATFSFLPLFCLPWIQYSLSFITEYLLARFNRDLSLRIIQKELEMMYLQLSWSLSQIHRYVHRFVDNLPKIELVFRQIEPDCVLVPSDQGVTKRAKKVLDMIVNGFPTIQSFAQLFFDQCHCSFLAPIH